MNNHKKIESREQVAFTSCGLTLFGILHRPLGINKAPIVICCHGFGGHKSGKNRVYVNLAERLVHAGIAVLRFDFRGCGDSEGDFKDMTILREVVDTHEAIKFLQKDPRIDLSRLGFLGKSLGGLVSLITARQQGGVKTIALWAPAFHAEQWRQAWTMVQNPETTEEQKKKIMQFDGQEAGYAFLEEFFTIRLEEELPYLKHIPMLHIHGEKDYSVDISHANLYEKHRNGSSAENRIIRLPNSDHDFSDIDEREIVVSETVKWFIETL